MVKRDTTIAPSGRWTTVRHHSACAADCPHPTTTMSDSGEAEDVNDVRYTDQEVGASAPTVTTGLARDAGLKNVGQILDHKRYSHLAYHINAVNVKFA